MMDENSKSPQSVDLAQKRVVAEIAALKSSSKIQNMFRINKSKSSPVSDSPRNQRRQSTTDIDLDEDTMMDVSKSRSAIANMFESKGPKITFGGSLKADKPVEHVKPKPIQKKEEGDINERKWVFDTIQKYFDVIVEEEKEEDEEDEEDEEEDDDDEGDYVDDSDSDYTEAEYELPEIDLPPPRERSGTLPNIIPIITKPKELPKLNLPSVQRTASLRVSTHTERASTVSPACIPARNHPERKISAISINDIIDDAARQFDQMTDGSDLSLDDSPVTSRLKTSGVTQSASSQNNQLQKSGSSSRIRGMLQSVIHGSNTSLQISAFKSNLKEHLSNSRSGSRCSSVAPLGSNLDPGVGDDSSSEYSEYD